MNCKPGDLAVLAVSHVGNEGKFVRVVNADVFELPGDLAWPGMHLWRCELLSDLRDAMGFLDRAGTHRAISDAWLRPIRDPGDDAKDETLSWLPVPKVEGVSA